MRIQVSGRQIDVGEALQTHVATALDEATAKYAGRPTEATVVFSRQSFEICCEVTVHLSTGLTAQAKGAAVDAYQAFGEAGDRLAKQMRRHKRRLKEHHKARPGPVELLPAEAYVLAPFTDDEAAVEDTAGDDLGGLGPEDGAAAGPTIIAETRAAVPSLTVGEAVMQMELAHAPVLVFRNERRGGINVVYRREDGNIGWIDPHGDAGEAAGRASPAGG